MARARNDPPSNTGMMELIAREHLLLLAFLFFVIFGIFLTYLYFGRTLDNPLSRIPATAPITAITASSNGDPQSIVIQRHANSTGPTLIGIISGHRGSDSGAVCDDGTTEAATNLRISEIVLQLLEARGIEAELLDEYDARLTPNYTASAVISIHADSCAANGNPLSGYKTAISAAPGAAQLQQCIELIYTQQTGLEYNVNTITNDMTNYHAFSTNQLSTVVPAIIIETGFLSGDKALLVNQPEIPAQAITDGIICFVEQLP